MSCRNTWQCGLTIVLACIALSACAPAIPVQDAQLRVQPSAQAEPIRVAQQEVTIRLSSGYQRTIAAQSRWSRVGLLPQGEVLRPVGTIFTIEGRQVHEAYLVVAQQNIVGFYLPGESHFSPLDKPVSIVFGELHD